MGLEPNQTLYDQDMWKEGRTKRKTNEDSLIEAVHKVKEGFLRIPLVGLQIDMLLARFAPPCFGAFRLGSEVVLAPKNDLVVSVVEGFI